jgi:hypothetical protein
MGPGILRGSEVQVEVEDGRRKEPRQKGSDLELVEVRKAESRWNIVGEGILVYR